MMRDVVGGLRKETRSPGMPGIRGGLKLVLGIVVVLLLLFMLRFWVVVPAGHCGVVLQFGAVRGSMGEGLHLLLPVVQRVVLLDVRVQKVETEAAAASRDLQNVKSLIAVNYHVDAAAASDLYQKVGLRYPDTIIAPAVQECVKAVTAQYTAEELITERQQVSARMRELLGAKLVSYGIVVDGFNVVNFDFSEEFNRAIEAKQAAEQLALKAQRDLDRVKIEAEQKLTQARAEAEALRIQKQEVTPELLRLREIEAMLKAIEKWDGKLPQVTGGAVPFLDVAGYASAGKK